MATSAASAAAYPIAAAAASAVSTRSGHLLVADFDGTCTMFDTTPIVPHLAAHFSAEPETVLARFQTLEESYFELLSECKDELEVSEEVIGGYDAAGLEASLLAMDNVSNVITEQLSRSGILAGIRAAEVAQVLSAWRADPSAAPVRVPELREGCDATLASASARDWQLAILSLNWCPPLIHAMLPVLEASAPPPAPVWSNRIEEASGTVANEVNGAGAKRAVIERLVQSACEQAAQCVNGAEGSAAETSRVPRVVYIGDSATDLLAMLSADIGILIGESQSARDYCRRFGVTIHPLSEAKSKGVGSFAALCEAGASAEALVWEAASWDEVRHCLEL